MEATNSPALFTVEEFSPTLITPKMARGRIFSGFSEIRIKESRIECDYVMSNGRLSSQGTFHLQYRSDDDAGQMVKAVTAALGDAFKRFERMKA